MTVTIQNAVNLRDGGVAISCMMFFRLISGAFGVALLRSGGCANCQGEEGRESNSRTAWFSAVPMSKSNLQ